MKSLGLFITLTVLIGFAASKAQAHPGHSDAKLEKPWYGYLPKSALSHHIRLFP